MKSRGYLGIIFRCRIYPLNGGVKGMKKAHLAREWTECQMLLGLMKLMPQWWSWTSSWHPHHQPGPSPMTRFVNRARPSFPSEASLLKCQRWPAELDLRDVWGLKDGYYPERWKAENRWGLKNSLKEWKDDSRWAGERLRYVFSSRLLITLEVVRWRRHIPWYSWSSCAITASAAISPGVAHPQVYLTIFLEKNEKTGYGLWDEYEPA